MSRIRICLNFPNLLFFQRFTNNANECCKGHIWMDGSLDNLLYQLHIGSCHVINYTYRTQRGNSAYDFWNLNVSRVFRTSVPAQENRGTA